MTRWASSAPCCGPPLLCRHPSPCSGRVRWAAQPEVFAKSLARILGLREATALQLRNQQAGGVLEALGIDRRAQEEAVGDFALEQVLQLVGDGRGTADHELVAVGLRVLDG